jgi:hypothetical protein
MKKICSLFLILTMIVAVTACSQQAGPAETPASVQTDAQNTSAGVVMFADPVLEAMVRATMGKPEGGIAAAEAQTVTRLNLSAEWWQQYAPQNTPIKNIGGLESFTNLESLDLSAQAITDIAPLSGLTKLTALSLGGNPITDIAPLAKLTNLKWLKLTGCAAQDYSPLVSLVNLNCLMLNQSTISDVSILAGLTNLEYLFLADSQAKNYLPLMELYPNLEQSDFTVSATLAGLGFNMDNGSKLATYVMDKSDIRINHAEWGAPPEDWMKNCVRTVFERNGYKVDIGYYPDSDAYVMQANKDGNMVMNYVYDHANDSFIGVEDRNGEEQTVRAIFTGADAGDVLLIPVQTFQDTLAETLGMTADTLFAMPFEPPTLENLGFVPDGANAAYLYDEKEPHDMHISIYRPEWGKSPDGQDMDFYDDDVNGYHLLIQYFADAGKYHVALFKDGADCAFDYLSATKEYGGEHPDPNTIKQMFNDAFGTQGEDFRTKPLAHFEQLVQERFGMSVDELYALPIR